MQSFERAFYFAKGNPSLLPVGRTREICVMFPVFLMGGREKTKYLGETGENITLVKSGLT